MHFIDKSGLVCPGVTTMSRSEPRSIHSYHTTEEIIEMWRRNRERSEWTLQQHEEWNTFLYCQRLARDRRYKLKSPSECLSDTATTSFSWSTVFCAIIVFHDNIYDCVVWSKGYIYEFICPDCSIRGISTVLTLDTMAQRYEVLRYIWNEGVREHKHSSSEAP